MKRISLLYIVSFFVFFGCGGLEQVVTETKKQLPDSSSPVREGDVQTHAVADGNSGAAGESSSGQKSTTPQMTFAAMFPDAWGVEWENERGLLKAEFRQGYHEKEAWFRTDGTWVRTVTDLRLSEVPSAVLSSVKTRTGSGWTIEDIDLVEQAESPAVYYLVECEKVGTDIDIHVQLTPDGILLNESDWKTLVDGSTGSGNSSTGGNSGTTGGSGAQGSTPQMTFAAMFPDAWDVEWENERGLLKVEFRQGYHEKEAWFRTDGTWVRTVTDLKLSEVPSAVLSSVKTRTGSGWKIEDIDLVEQAESPAVYYLAECEKVGTDIDIHVQLTPDGILLNESDWKTLVDGSTGSGNSSTGGNSGTTGGSGAQGSTPQMTFAAMFPDAWDVEWENERGLLKVEFRQGYHEKEAWFRTDGTWVRTVTDLKLSEVPSAVLSSVKTRTGSGWTIEDIDLVEQAESPAVYYLVECEKVGSEQEIHLRIAPDGTIL